MQQRIEGKLGDALGPVHLEVINESAMHNVPPGSETHFKVLVVSPVFEGLGLVDRHRKVNEALREELKSGVHALSIRALTPSQWDGGGAAGFVSPKCLGGSKADA
ncbi:MAG: BolA family protein [Minicystis sp.]